jgi:hypothetical protein
LLLVAEQMEAYCTPAENKQHSQEDGKTDDAQGPEEVNTMPISTEGK